MSRSISMRHRARRLVVHATGMTCVLLLFTGPVLAQIPDTFTNLKVLPKDISRGELVGIMRGFADALGVRCSHCHVSGMPNSLEYMDFAVDDQEPKRVARAMMQMTQTINHDLLTKIGRESPVEVRCVTCHHGLREPETLEQALLASLEEGGTEALVARYGELREKFYGRAAYDFGELSLPSMAERLFRSGKTDVALTVLELNLEHFPSSGPTLSLIGEAKMQGGDEAGALAAFEKALAIDPSNPRAKQRIEQIKAKMATGDRDAGGGDGDGQ